MSDTGDVTQVFTDQQLKNFKNYCKVQKSGLFNMFDPRARMLTTMAPDEWVFCMKNYDKLEEASKRV